MKRETIITLVFIWALCIMPVYAAQLSVEKATKNTDISVGDNVEIMLKFKNPFGKEIPIKIEDKNILGGNGVEIQCMEYTVPAQASVDVFYPAIQAFEKGSFVLRKAKINYTNPETGNEETIESNEFNIDIKESSASQNIQQQGITTVYQCNGVSMQSTSYSSSSTQSNSNNQNQQNPTQDKLNNMQQQNQNMQSIKEEMQRQAEIEEQIKKELEEKIESDQGFKKQEEDLKKEGYERAEKKISPGENQSTGESTSEKGSFEYSYKKENGETAELSGEFEDGSISDMKRWSTEDEKKAMQGIEQDKKFKNIEDALKKEGYSLQNKSVSPTEKNATSFQYNYANPVNNATASITGNATIEGNVTQINLEKKDEKKNRNWLWFLFLLILAIALYAYYRKKRKDHPLENIVPVKKKIPLDYRKKALRMIESAEKMFNSGNKKEAYFKVSRALRFYFKHKFNKQEMTSTDILREIKGLDAKYVKSVRDCFSTCDLVNFAKYEANSRDFKKIMSLSKEIIV